MRACSNSKPPQVLKVGESAVKSVQLSWQSSWKVYSGVQQNGSRGMIPCAISAGVWGVSAGPRHIVQTRFGEPGAAAATAALSSEPAAAAGAAAVVFAAAGALTGAAEAAAVVFAAA